MYATGHQFILAIDGASLLYNLLKVEDWRYGGQLERLQQSTKQWLDQFEPWVDSMVVFVDVVSPKEKEGELISRQKKRVRCLQQAYDRACCPPFTFRAAAALSVFLRIMRRSKKVSDEVSLYLSLLLLLLLISRLLYACGCLSMVYRSQCVPPV